MFLVEDLYSAQKNLTVQGGDHVEQWENFPQGNTRGNKSTYPSPIIQAGQKSSVNKCIVL